MPIQTHPKFESSVPFIKTPQDIKYKINEALNFQHTFERTTTDSEISSWDYEELQKIIINVDKIDRLYDIVYDENGDDNNLYKFELVARMKEGESLLYVNLDAYCNYHLGFNNDDDSYGIITVSKYPKLFVKSIIISKEIENLILNDAKKEKLLNFSPSLFKTHLNFSYFYYHLHFVSNATQIYRKITGALYYQDKFERKTTIQEISNWKSNEELQNIKINVELIDRLYNIYFNRNKRKSVFILVARMDYINNNKPLYVKLSANFNHVDKYKYIVDGCIMVSHDYKLFVNEFITRKFIKECILDDSHHI